MFISYVMYLKVGTTHSIIAGQNLWVNTDKNKLFQGSNEAWWKDHLLVHAL